MAVLNTNLKNLSSIAKSGGEVAVDSRSAPVSR